MNRSVKYTITTPNWIDFNKPLSDQMSTISSTVTGLKQGLEALKNERKLGLRDVETLATEEPRFSYEIWTTLHFPTNSFATSKPLVLRDVTEIKVKALSGKDTYVQTQADNIKNTLAILNRFLKENLVPTGKQRLQAWDANVVAKINEMNAFAVNNGCIEDLNPEINLDNINQPEQKSYWQYLPSLRSVGNCLLETGIGTILVTLTLCWRNHIVNALWSYYNNQPLENTLQIFLSNLPTDSKTAYISQFLQAAEQRPELLNILPMLLSPIYKIALNSAIVSFIAVSFMYIAFQRYKN